MTQGLLPEESWAVRMADSALRNYPSTQWKWHYEQGLLIQAAAALGLAATGRANRFQAFAQAWVDHFVAANGEIPSYRPGEFNLDLINPGKLLFPRMRETGEDRYAAALHRLRQQLRAQPRTPSGGFWHKQIYPNQMWLDGLYMAGPFLAEYAITFAEPAIFDDLARQFTLVEQHHRDPNTGLLYHAWDESKTQPWANPVTGCSPHFWGRGMGWYVMALVDTLAFLPEDHALCPLLVGFLQRLAEALLRYQDAASGLWFQVVNLPERAGNYRETSASAMLAYGFAKAARRGWLAPEFRSAAGRAYHGLLENRVRVDARGFVSLDGICSVAGLGGTPYRDGSYRYYVQEPVVTNDFKGVGPFILAGIEMEKRREWYTDCTEGHG